MNTNEAINYVESKRYVMEHCDNNKLADEVIDLLKCGEKYETILREIEKLISSQISEETSYATLVWLRNKILELKQKYFPKVKKTITFTIEAPTKDHLGTAINDFEMFWASYNEVKGHCIKYSYAKEGD